MSQDLSMKGNIIMIIIASIIVIIIYLVSVSGRDLQAEAVQEAQKLGYQNITVQSNNSDRRCWFDRDTAEVYQLNAELNGEKVTVIACVGLTGIVRILKAR